MKKITEGIRELESEIGEIIKDYGLSAFRRIKELVEYELSVSSIRDWVNAIRDELYDLPEEFQEELDELINFTIQRARNLSRARAGQVGRNV